MDNTEGIKVDVSGKSSEMNIGLSSIDRQKVNKLGGILEMNNDVLGLLGRYLTVCPDFVTRELMEGMTDECGIAVTKAYVSLLAAVCGLDVESNSRDRYMVTAYLHSGIRQLSPQEYRMNPYYRQIRIPEAHLGNWKLTVEKYKPYEAFVCDDIRLDEEFREIPQIGFFDTEFSFPAVMENGREWMAIKPNEIETMRLPIARATGKVVAFGLGMGYYAFMVSEKPEVKKLTIVERDENVIALFREYILPQFPQKDKIDIVRQDAFEFVANHMAGSGYEHAFVDLWHDVSDGYPLYKRMKALEKNSPDTLFSYWIEDALLSHLRWEVFHRMRDSLFADGAAGDTLITWPVHTYEQFAACLRNPFLRELAKRGDSYRE